MDVINCPANRSDLLYDTACLEVNNNLDYPVSIFSLSSECYQCSPSHWTTVPLQTSVSLVVSAVHSVSLSAVEQGGSKGICQQTLSFTEHEVVSWNIEKCTFTTVENGNNIFIPLYFFASCVASLLLLLAVVRTVYHSQWFQKLITRDPAIIDLQNDLGNPNSSSDSLPLVQSELIPLRRLSTPRILALDTFRGFTIALMIFVNYGGGKYWFFEHSAWNGITLADFVFPWFAWVMGVSLVLSYRSKLRSCVTRREVLWVSLRRTVSLVVLGLLVNMYGNNNLSTVRFCGVLQRLGIAHLFVSALEIAYMKKQPSFRARRWLPVSELIESSRQWLVILLLVMVHLAVTFQLSVPGCPKGYLGPGGAGNHSATPLCTGGAARYIDSTVFTDQHLYNRGPVRRVYHPTVPFDPEGILGTLTTCLTVYLGVVAGYITLCYNSTRERCTHWIFWAVLTGISAGFLCDWSQEGGWIPINKQLWSVSFALLTSSTGFLFLAILYVIVDHFHWWSGDLFRHAGMNAILLYIGHIITKNTFPWSWKPYDLTHHNELFAMNVGGVLLWLLIARVLHRHEIFLSI